MTSDELTTELMHLFKVGAINVTYDENLEARFEITKKGKTVIENWREQ